MKYSHLAHDSDVQVHHERRDLACSAKYKSNQSGRLSRSLTCFPIFPKPSWNVEEDGLEEESEADPLVVGHVSPLVLLVVGAGHDARVGHVPPHVEGEGAGDGVPGQSTLQQRSFLLCAFIALYLELTIIRRSLFRNILSDIMSTTSPEIFFPAEGSQHLPRKGD